MFQMVNVKASSTENRFCVSLFWYPANDNGCKFYNPQTKQILRSRDVIFMEDKFDVEKLNCTQENFELFTGLGGNAENNDTECKNEQGDHLTD